MVKHQLVMAKIEKCRLERETLQLRSAVKFLEIENQSFKSLYGSHTSRLAVPPPGILSTFAHDNDCDAAIWTYIQQGASSGTKDDLVVVQVLSTPRAGKSLLLDHIYKMVRADAPKPLRITYNSGTPWRPAKRTHKQRSSFSRRACSAPSVG